MKMSELMGNVMNDDDLAIHILSSVVSSRDNIDLRHIIRLIEDESNKHNPQNINDELELKNQNQDIIDIPHPEIKTRSRRIITQPKRLTY